MWKLHFEQYEEEKDLTLYKENGKSGKFLQWQLSFTEYINSFTYIATHFGSGRSCLSKSWKHSTKGDLLTVLWWNLSANYSLKD